MEANTQLMRVIQEMRAEINKLEKENQALRMKLTSSSQRTPGSGGESKDEKEDEITDLGNLGEAPGQSPAALHSGVSTDSAPAVREHQGNVMIVRRYSISSPTHSLPANDSWKAGEKHPKRGILEAQRAVKSLAYSSIKKQDNEKQMFAPDSFTSNDSSQRAFSEHGFGYRDKIKTVSFLLPMNMSSCSKNSSSLKYLPNQTTNQLSTITE
ncbi:putative coiled-coil domain-containing protein 195 [Hippopotamus amphibius kiboko]|uniref:putative coiled-coil domain-containing protein 195 n=1 Tax=Hippopotamus amphibius kiboko TaxID=575201 RepID=UPI002597E7D1|nr:putative coiled-coil domain-containing protein 195 [Hippopotamus amphibius kiboko]